MMKKKLVCLVLVFILIAGCAGMSDSTRTKAEGSAAGAGLGAILGAIAGQIIGKDTESTLKGAAIGAAIGAIAGGAYGDHVAYKKAEYAKEEDYLNACIASTRQINGETRQYNESLRGEISGLEDEVRTLVAQYNRKKISKANLTEKQKQVQAKLSEAQKKLQRAKDEVVIQKEVLAQGKGKSKAEQAELAKLDREIKNLQRTAEELEGQTQALAGINQSIKL